MASKEVKFGVDARDRMLRMRGVDILNNAVKELDDMLGKRFERFVARSNLKEVVIGNSKR